MLDYKITKNNMAEFKPDNTQRTCKHTPSIFNGFLFPFFVKNNEVKVTVLNFNYNSELHYNEK
jgi:hypothetical protein